MKEILLETERLVLRELTESDFPSLYEYGHDPDNLASQRVLIKLGMKNEGRLRQDKQIRGRWRDSLLYAILEDEWKAGR